MAIRKAARLEQSQYQVKCKGKVTLKNYSEDAPGDHIQVAKGGLAAM